jgi:hypothetical protein
MEKDNNTYNGPKRNSKAYSNRATNSIPFPLLFRLSHNYIAQEEKKPEHEISVQVEMNNFF